MLEYISKKYIDNNRNISYVFQDDRLIPWKTIYENLCLVSKDRYDSKTIKSKINSSLEDVGLLEYSAYYPSQLSGGMKQRVNIARAMLINFDIIIMDEPFKSIHGENKSKIINKMKNIFEEFNATVIFVSHYEEEIHRLADKVIRLAGEPIRIVEEYYVNKIDI